MTIRYYTHSRKMGPYTLPISIQSVYLRNYASSRSYPFSLSVTEYPVFSCYFSLVQRLSSFKHYQSINIICTTIYIFQEIRSDSSVYHELKQFNLNIVGVLEGVSGTIDTIMEILSDLEFTNNLACVVI